MTGPDSQRVAIIGAGGIACGYAAFLDAAGHQPVLYSPSGAGTAALRDAPLRAAGALTHVCRPEIAASPAEAVSGASGVIFALPALGHLAMMKAVAPHLTPGQTVIISAQQSMSALVLDDLLVARGLSTPILALATTVLMGKRSAPDEVTVGGIRPRLEAAVLPTHRANSAIGYARALFGDRFTLARNLAAIALSNLNPPVHMANALCNFTRIENGEAWRNYAGITPSVARLIEALDAERLALAAAHGLTVRSVEEHYRRSFSFPAGLSVAQMASQVDRDRGGPPGPTSLDTRFVTEDVPFGLAFLETMGRHAGMGMPLHRAGIDLLSALYDCDFRSENDLLPLIQLDDPRAFQAPSMAG